MVSMDQIIAYTYIVEKYIKIPCTCTTYFSLYQSYQLIGCLELTSSSYLEFTYKFQ